MKTELRKQTTLNTVVENFFPLRQVSQLNSLIGLLLGELSSGSRQKIMTVCTIDVHARDIVASLIAQKVPAFFLLHIYGLSPYVMVFSAAPNIFDI